MVARRRLPILISAVLALAAAPGDAGLASAWAEPPLPAPDTTATPETSGWVRLPSGLPDYAPSGLPDFDQRQGNWVTTDPNRGSWTHDGPVAAANALWWLDSRDETGDTPPPAVVDGFGLVEPYGGWDDHSDRNVRPLVRDVAVRSDTDGPLTRLAYGTCMDNLEAGVRGFLAAAGDASGLSTRSIDLPTVDQMAIAVAREHPVVLLLGMWQHHEMTGWQRIGGHYVTLEGVDTRIGRLSFSDPFRDVATGPTDGLDHNNAGHVSHDTWIVSPSLRPGPVLRIEGYLEGDSESFVLNFVSLNRRSCDDADVPWLDGVRLEAHVDAALLIESGTPGTDAPTATTPDVPVTPGTPSHTASPVATTATRVPTARPSTTPTATAPASPTSGQSPPAPTATVRPSPAVPTVTLAPTPRSTPTNTTLPAPTPSPTVPPDRAPGDICGSVRDERSGRGLVGAEVWLWRDDALLALTYADEAGAYCFRELPWSRYHLLVAAPRCGQQERDVNVSGTLTRADFSLRCSASACYLPLAVAGTGSR